MIRARPTLALGPGLTVNEQADVDEVSTDSAQATDEVVKTKKTQAITPIQRAKNSPSNHDVIVIGAGMAGMTTARELQERGLNVVVLEAQPRVGGRAMTDTDRFSLPMDMGAGWLHGIEHNVLAPLADKMGMTRVRSTLTGSLYIDGRKATPEELAQYDKEREAFEGRMGDAAAKGRDVSAATLLDPKARFAKTIADQLGPFESSTELAQTSVMDAGAFESDQDDFVKEGIGTMVERMAEGLPIETGKPIKSIKYGTSGVEVTTLDGQVYRGKKAVVTVSTGVLASGKIEFDPPLPEWKKKAIEAVPMGVLDKVVMEFDENVFGDTKENSWIALDDMRTDVPMAFVLRPHGSNIAIGFVGGEVAKRMEQKPAKELVGEAMNKLGEMFGTAMVQKHLANSAVTRWASNPWTLGSYSVASPGGAEMRKVLAKPVSNSLFFAGEAMARPEVNGSLNGAYETGLEAAKMVARQIVSDATHAEPVAAAFDPISVRSFAQAR